MASACVNSVGMPPENFIDSPAAKFQSYGWLSPRISLSRELPDEAVAVAEIPVKNQPKPNEPDLESSDKGFVDFEFHLEDPVKMLPADELFSDGKLVPLQIADFRHSLALAPASSKVRSPDAPKFRRRNEISATDPYLFSPRAPRCSSRWKELLGLKKLYQNSNSKPVDHRIASPVSSQTHNKSAARSLKHLLHRSSKSSLNPPSNSSLNLPLLKDSDLDSVSISARLSLSSSSSGHEHDDLPRLSLDFEKPSAVTRKTHQTTRSLSKVRVAKPRAAFSSENPTPPTRAGLSPIRRAPESAASVLGVSVDSPRMNSSGKIVFHSLERSSSSPSSLNGDPRYKPRGVERSYSANVRITPVLNVPVCSLRGSSKSGVFGFPLFHSQQRRENGGGHRSLFNHNKNRTDRTGRAKAKPSILSGINPI